MSRAIIIQVAIFATLGVNFDGAIAETQSRSLITVDHPLFARI